MGNANLTTSRRSFKLLCEWYKVKSNDTKLLHEEQPIYFKARWETAKTDNNDLLGGIVQIKHSQLTLLTCDYVDEMKPNDKVKVNDTEFLVVDTQRVLIKKQSEYLKNPSVMTYITLKQ